MRFPLTFAALLGLFAIGCATQSDGDTTSSGEGGADATTSSSSSGGAGGATGGEGGGTASSSTGGACLQDCSAIETPECFVAVCNEETGVCELGPDEDGAECEDGEFCTVNDTCQDGTCQAGDPMVCRGGADDCLLVACDEAADACVGTPVGNGEACTSADLCTINAICQNGVCLGAPKDCSATPVPNDCNIAQCDANQNGDCVPVPVNDGQSCLIGDPCESNKMCLAGACTGTPIVGCSQCSELEPNNDLASANDDPTCTAWQGQIGVIADHDWFEVIVTVPGSRIRAETTDLSGTGCPTNPSFDSWLRLYNSTGVEIGNNNTATGNSPCSLIDLNVAGSTNLAAGTYYVRVEESGNNLASNPYLLSLAVFPPGCGDSILQAGEACDDGNTANGDNCDSTCQLEPNVCGETEPNGSIALAEDDATCNLWAGAISPIADIDYYEVEVTVPGSRVRAATKSISGTGCPTNPSFDSMVRLFNASGVELGNNNTAPANSPCSLIDTNVPASLNLPVGFYYVSVEESGNNLASNTYLLELDVFAPGCGDGILQTGEQCDDANAIDGDGCSSTCTLFDCAAGEVAVTVDSTNVPLALPDNVTTTSTLTVAQTGTVTKLAVVMNITHTWTADLDISFDAPGALPVILANDVGSSGDHFTNTVFSSDSTTAITTGAPPFTGVFAPQGGFATMLGTPANGTWSLLVTDDLGGFAGTLNAWKVVACVQP